MEVSFEDIISLENLLLAWQEFLRGKRHKGDVQEFGRNLMDNLLELSDDLARGTYKHGGYAAFLIADPKPRRIHKASVRDRLLHHALHRVLYPFFDRVFIADSFSCRKGKGVHKALNRFQEFGRRAGRNHTYTCWVLKCDVRKFFDSIDHEVLLEILRKRIPDKDVERLLANIIQSFMTIPGKGLPLGNLTSQLLVNVYMNEFDQFVKHSLNVPYYVRYADDFVLMSPDRKWLATQLGWIEQFLGEHLQLTLHPNKVFIKTMAGGVDFLGWIYFPDHRRLRTSTARRMKKRIYRHPELTTLQAYLGLLQHGNTKLLQESVKSDFGFYRTG